MDLFQNHGKRDRKSSILQCAFSVYPPLHRTACRSAGKLQPACEHILKTVPIPSRSYTSGGARLIKKTPSCKTALQLYIPCTKMHVGLQPKCSRHPNSTRAMPTLKPIVHPLRANRPRNYLDASSCSSKSSISSQNCKLACSRKQPACEHDEGNAHPKQMLNPSTLAWERN
jgi:hypothetical protein